MGCVDCGGGAPGPRGGAELATPGEKDPKGWRSEVTWLSVSRRLLVPLEDDSFNPRDVALMRI